MRQHRRRSTWFAWWDGKLRSLIFDLFVAGFGVQFGDLGRDGGIATWCLASAAFVGVLLRRRFPWAAVGAAVALNVFVAPTLITEIAAYTVARRRGPAIDTWVAYPILLASSMVPFTYSSTSNTVIEYLLGFAFAAVLVGSPLIFGLWMHQRRALVVGYRERAEQAERERDLLAERAVVTERRRIAREMHDVVAHRVSVIALQAGALSMTTNDQRTEEVAEVIRSTSSTALAELRAMLRVLRDDAEDSESSSGTSASATVEDIPRLVDEAVAAGAHIHRDLPEHFPEVSTETGRAAYRVVQEALTNAGKHAPHSAVEVSVDVEDDDLVVVVANRRSCSTEGDAVPGAGYGLIGMRERVVLAGGTLMTGRTEDGGYRVRAVLPTGNAEEAK